MLTMDATNCAINHCNYKLVVFSVLVISLGLSVMVCFVITVDYLLTDTSVKWTPRVGLCLYLLTLYLTFYKTDTLCQNQRCPSYSL